MVIFPTVKPGAGQNVAFHAFPAARNVASRNVAFLDPCFCLCFAFLLFSFLSFCSLTFGDYFPFMRVHNK